MVEFASLWLPILLSAVFVFIVSSLIHMCLKIHDNDYGRLAREDDVMDALHAHGVTRGHYAFPRPESMKDCGSPEVVKRFERGPVGFLTVLDNGIPPMGKSLVLWFALSLAISAVTAYVASRGLAAGASAVDIAKTAAPIAWLAYGVGSIQESIWKGISWAITIRFLFDATLYAATTAATFAWLWPAAS